jgi:tetratricopeptide (TPR) repeat protein
MKEHAPRLARQANADRQGRQFDRAIAAFTLALRMSGQDDELFLDRGRTYAQSGALDDALDDFARLARAHPENAMPVQEAAAVLEGRGDRDESIACWTGFIQTNPTSGAAYRARSEALNRRGMKGLSRADAQKACELGERAACVRLSDAR